QISLRHTLKGHSKGINCLSVSLDGTLLLSGGDDAKLVVWNLGTGEDIQHISCVVNGAVGAVAWITFGTVDSAFVFGCADGTLHVYRRQCDSQFQFCTTSIAHSGPVEGIAFDRTHRKVATVGGGGPQVWNVSITGLLTPVVQTPPHQRFVPRGVEFCDNGASIVVCYLESHDMYVICYAIEPWAVKWSSSIPTRIGHASISGDGQHMVVSNLTSGVDVYSFPSLERIQQFSHVITCNVPLQVATAQKGALVVSGGDAGFARVYERSSGKLVASLTH
ncbi:WD40 repeat-like protein, partial [Rickenella mellea]